MPGWPRPLRSYRHLKTTGGGAERGLPGQNRSPANAGRLVSGFGQQVYPYASVTYESTGTHGRNVPGFAYSPGSVTLGFRRGQGQVFFILPVSIFGLGIIAVFNHAFNQRGYNGYHACYQGYCQNSKTEIIEGSCNTF